MFDICISVYSNQRQLQINSNRSAYWIKYSIYFTIVVLLFYFVILYDILYVTCCHTSFFDLVFLLTVLSMDRYCYFYLSIFYLSVLNFILKFICNKIYWRRFVRRVDHFRIINFLIFSIFVVWKNIFSKKGTTLYFSLLFYFQYVAKRYCFWSLRIRMFSEKIWIASFSSDLNYY